MMRVLLVVVALSFSVTSEAFNRDRCGQLFPKYEDYHPPYYSPLYVSTMIPSTSSYFTSTGPCSMYGDASLRRAMFIHDNYDLIVKDASRGQGEHIETLAMLSGCQVQVQERFATSMKSEFAQIASQKERLAEVVDQIIASDDVLTKSCPSLN